LVFCNQILDECSCENASYLKNWGQSDKYFFELVDFESSCSIKNNPKPFRTGGIHAVPKVLNVWMSKLADCRRMANNVTLVSRVWLSSCVCWLLRDINSYREPPWLVLRWTKFFPCWFFFLRARGLFLRRQREIS